LGSEPTKNYAPHNSAMTGTALSPFLDEHDELHEVISQLRRALANPSCDMADLHRLVWRLSFLISKHVSVEDSHVYPLLRNDPRPHIQAVVARFTGKIGALKIRVAAWRADWTGDRIAADRPGFAAATTELMNERSSDGSK
jgi:hypothetical protein